MPLRYPALSYVLEKDSASRPLLRWEANDSALPSPGDHRNDARVEGMRVAAAMMDAINPRIKVVQSEEADGPTECISVLSQDFKSLLWEALASVPAYGEWLRTFGVELEGAAFEAMAGYVAAYDIPLEHAL